MSISLPLSKIADTKQYTLPAAAQSGIDRVVKDLENQSVITPPHSPYNSPVWPVKKLKGQWRLTIDYRRLNANTAPLTAAVPSIAELITQIQGVSHTWMAILDVKDTFFMVPLQEHDKAQFPFTWKGIQYTFKRLPRGYKHSPTFANNSLAKTQSGIPVPSEVTLYQYIDDLLIEGEQFDTVKQAIEDVTLGLTTLGLEIAPSKCQGPTQEVKFLGSGRSKEPYLSLLTH